MNWNEYKKTLPKWVRLKIWWSEFKLKVWRDWLKRCPRCYHKVLWDWEVETGDFGVVLAKYKFHHCAKYMAGCPTCGDVGCDEELICL